MWLTHSKCDVNAYHYTALNAVLCFPLAYSEFSLDLDLYIVRSVCRQLVKEAQLYLERAASTALIESILESCNVRGY